MSDCIDVQTLRRGGAGARHDHAEGGQADGGGPRQVLLPLPSRPDQAGQLSVSEVWCYHLIILQECGEILFGLSYLPTAQRLSFSLVKVTGIKAEKSVEEPISE